METMRSCELGSRCNKKKTRKRKAKRQMKKKAIAMFRAQRAEKHKTPRILFLQFTRIIYCKVIYASCCAPCCASIAPFNSIRIIELLHTSKGLCPKESLRRGLAPANSSCWTRPLSSSNVAHINAVMPSVERAFTFAPRSSKRSMKALSSLGSSV